MDMNKSEYVNDEHSAFDDKVSNKLSQYNVGQIKASRSVN
jgi:hypothetical protein